MVKIYKDKYIVEENNEVICKRCRLIEVDSLDNIRYIEDDRNVLTYYDDYTMGNLFPIHCKLLMEFRKENELCYKIRLWNSDILILKFIKLEM